MKTLPEIEARGGELNLYNYNVLCHTVNIHGPSPALQSGINFFLSG